MAGYLLLFGIVVYLGLALWIISRWYLPVKMLKLTPEARKNRRHPLALNTYQILHILHSILFFLVLIWLPVTFAIIALPHGVPGFTGEMKVFAMLHADFSQLPGVELSGTKSQGFSTNMELKVLSPNRVNYLVFAIGGLVKTLMLLNIMLQLRNVLVSLCNGESFAEGNSTRLNRAGQFMVIYSIFVPFWDFFESGSVINGLKFNTEALSFTASTHFNWVMCLAGLGVLVLSGVIREAEQLQKEQRLTI